MKNELMNFEVFDNSKEAENLIFKRKCSEIDITFKSRTDLSEATIESLQVLDGRFFPDIILSSGYPF